MNVLEHQQVPVSILVLPEQSERHFACGVVYGAHEGEVWSSALEPVVLAAIYL